MDEASVFMGLSARILSHFFSLRTPSSTRDQHMCESVCSVWSKLMPENDQWRRIQSSIKRSAKDAASQGKVMELFSVSEEFYDTSFFDLLPTLHTFTHKTHTQTCTLWHLHYSALEFHSVTIKKNNN